MGILLLYFAKTRYIDGSQRIQLFCSKGYFKSRNCLREVRATLEKQKPFCLVHDPDKGGAPLATIRDEECPSDMRGSIFDGRPVIQWHRIHEFQLVSLKLLAEQLLLN